MVVHEFRAIITSEGMNFKSLKELFGDTSDFFGPFAFKKSAENEARFTFDEDE